MEGLEFTSGPLKGERVEVTRELIAGREAELRLEDDEVSRRHSSLRPAAGGIEVEDLGSTNGTWVNDIEITSATLAPLGATVRIGTSEASVIDFTPGETRVARPATEGLTPGPATPEPPAPAPPAVPEPPVPAAPAPVPPGPAPFGTAPPPPVPATVPPPGPAPAVAAPPKPAASRSRPGTPATRLLGPEIATYATITLVAIALILYFAAR